MSRGAFLTCESPGESNGGALADLVELPLWVSVIVAAFFFVLMRFILPLLGATSVAANVLAQVSSTAAPLVAGLFLLAGLSGEVRRRWRQLVASRIDGLDAIRQLDWPAFEAYVAEVYRRQGYSVTERGGHHADGGVDLEVRRGGQRLLVQCKQWGHRQVPVRRVRELLGVVTSKGADRGVVVATVDSRGTPELSRPTSRSNSLMAAGW